MRTVKEIIEAAGRDQITRDCGVTEHAIKWWPRTGIPEKHWPHFIEHAGASPNELFEANRRARQREGAAA